MILETKHIIDGEELFLKQIVQSAPTTESFTELPPLINDGGAGQVAVSRTVVVSGFQHPIHEYILELYFTNETKSGGGPVDKIMTKEKEVYITFTDQTSRLNIN